MFVLICILINMIVCIYMCMYSMIYSIANVPHTETKCMLLIDAHRIIANVLLGNVFIIQLLTPLSV